MQDVIPRAEKAARLLEGAQRNDCGRGILDRRAAVRLAARLAWRVGVFPRRRGGLYAGGAARIDGHDRNAEPACAPRRRPMRCMRRGSPAQRFGASWALAETGATGPTGNRYGDAPGHTCIAVVGKVERAMTLETGMIERVENMRAVLGRGARPARRDIKREVAGLFQLNIGRLRHRRPFGGLRADEGGGLLSVERELLVADLRHARLMVRRGECLFHRLGQPLDHRGWRRSRCGQTEP